MEAALKIMAIGLFRYLKDRWNCFDLFVVSLSLIELGLSGDKAFSILRSFRLVRVVAECSNLSVNDVDIHWEFQSSLKFNR